MYQRKRIAPITEEMELDLLRLQIARERAEELVREQGWTEQDEDFSIQIEEETKRQWEEDCEREMWKRLTPDGDIL